jgi:hypothetical protein
LKGPAATLKRCTPIARDVDGCLAPPFDLPPWQLAAAIANRPKPLRIRQWLASLIFDGQALTPQLRKCEPFWLLIDQSKQNKPLQCGTVGLGSFALLKVEQLKDFLET